MSVNVIATNVVPDRNTFLELFEHHGTAPPVYYELENVPFNPVALFERVRTHMQYPFLLDSADGPLKVARYCIMGADPFAIFTSKGLRSEFRHDGRSEVLKHNPLDVLKDLLGRYHSPRVEYLPDFYAGAVGFFGYDVKNLIEELPDAVEDDLDLPEIALLFVDSAILLDRADTSVKICAVSPGEADPIVAYEKACSKIDHLRGVVGRCRPSEKSIQGHYEFGPLGSTHDAKSYAGMVRRAKEYIAAGDIFQANLSQRIHAGFSGDTLALYRSLRTINPSPFAFYFDFGGFQLVSCSPERLIKLSGKRVDTRPIAGTRPRGRSLEGDLAMTEELLLSPKQTAEHIMIVDMSRNDIGRVCEYGSVHPDELKVTEKYSHVIHIVSNIVGTIREGRGPIDLVRAVFPGASVTGVPKVRCMEIIDELETVRRGPYTGSAGWIGFSGDMDLNIIIRTFVIAKEHAFVQVGGGVVADSDPKDEYLETWHKARALVEALKARSG
jgi:anthranilate/para-aminobenzoate synthase component I